MGRYVKYFLFDSKVITGQPKLIEFLTQTGRMYDYLLYLKRKHVQKHQKHFHKQPWNALR